MLFSEMTPENLVFLKSVDKQISKIKELKSKTLFFKVVSGTYVLLEN